MKFLLIYRYLQNTYWFNRETLYLVILYLLIQVEAKV